MADRIGLALDLSGLEAIQSVAKQRGITLKSVKAGAKLIQAGAKSRASRRKGSGALRQSIGIKAVKGNRGKTLALAVIGARKKVVKQIKPPRGTKLIKAVPANYALLVEKGTAPHSIHKGARLARTTKDRKGRTKTKPAEGDQAIQHPGAKAKPFLGPAWAATKQQAVQAASQAFGVELQKAIAQQAAKMKARRR